MRKKSSKIFAKIGTRPACPVGRPAVAVVFHPLRRGAPWRAEQAGDPLLRTKLPDFMKRLVSKLKTCKPEKIILFGSAVSGNASFDSDIDICLIRKTKLRWHLRSMETRKLLFDDYPAPLDLFIYTPEEFDEFENDKMSFLSEILKKGIVVYDAKRR